MLHAVNCTLHVACCLLHAVCCMLPVACCVLHVACCLLHVACCLLHVARWHVGMVACGAVRLEPLPRLRVSCSKPRCVFASTVSSPRCSAPCRHATRRMRPARATCYTSGNFRKLPETDAPMTSARHVRPPACVCACVACVGPHTGRRALGAGKRAESRRRRGAAGGHLPPRAILPEASGNFRKLMRRRRAPPGASRP